MKKISLNLAIMVFMLCVILYASMVHANPFLVCDPQTDVTEYRVIVDGSETIVQAVDLGNGTVRLEYDCAGLIPGAHHFDVSARNLWGESEQVPFDCVKVLPGNPSGIGLETK